MNEKSPAFFCSSCGVQVGKKKYRKFHGKCEKCFWKESEQFQKEKVPFEAHEGFFSNTVEYGSKGRKC